MNILHIGKFYPPFHGGMEHYLCDLARQQAKQGHRVTVLVHNHQWRLLTAAHAAEHMDGVEVIRLRSFRPILFAPLMVGLNRQLRQLLKDQAPDVVHLHWPNPSLFLLLLNKSLKNIPWVIGWHSDMVTQNSKWLMKGLYRIIRPLESRLIHQAASLVVSTQAYADHSPQLTRHADKTHVIPLGLNTKDIQAMDETQQAESQTWAAQQWRDDQFKLFHLGRLTFYKNQKMLIDAMTLIQQGQLLIAGEGQLETDLQQQINRLQLAKRVRLLGRQSWSRVHALFQSCDVFCMASHDRAESFGVVLLEAMYHQKIILVPDTVGSGMRWLADHYAKGFVYQVNNPQDFALKIAHIKDNYAEITNRSGQFPFDIETIAEKNGSALFNNLKQEIIMNHHFKLVCVTFIAMMLMACQNQEAAQPTDDSEVNSETVVDKDDQVAYQKDPMAKDVVKKHSELLDKYATFKLVSDLSHLSEQQRAMLPLLVEAAQIMDGLFWLQSYGPKKAFLDGISDQRLRKFADINYGPWDRLDGDQPFLPGYEAKFPGDQFLPG